MQPDNSEDYYALLQVHPRASFEVIKKAYHILMQKNHPDRGGDLRLAQHINRAYDVLIDAQKRQHYDQQILRRQALIAQRQEQLRKQKLQARQQAKKQAQLKAQLLVENPPELKQLSGEREAPMIWGEFSIMADERGKRVIILNRKGETVWVYGKRASEKLIKPRMAQFTSEGGVLIADPGDARVLRLNLKKELLWEYTFPQLSPQERAQAQPVFCDGGDSGVVLVVDVGLRQVLLVNARGEVDWRFNGKLPFNLGRWQQYIRPELFMPVSAFALSSDRFLIADQGNGRVYELSRKGKVLWMYPDKKHLPLAAINFATRLANGSIWITSDKIIEISERGEVLWHYAKLEDADIKQAYPLSQGAFVIDYAHLVKRGVNQEVMVLDHSGKIKYRHYYSQHRFL